MSETVTNSGPASLVVAVSELADALALALSPQDIYDAALRGMHTAVGIERASVLLFDDDGVLRFKAWRGLSEEYRRAVEGHTPWTPGQPAPAPIVVRDVTADSALASYHDVFAREQIRALAFIPLLSGGRTIGKFMLYWREPRDVTGTIIDAAQIIGAFVGLAVDRARQNADAQRQQHTAEVALAREADARERLTRLAEGAQQLQISPDGGSIANRVLQFASHAVKADGYALWRQADGVWRCVAHAGLDAGFTRDEIAATDQYSLDGPIVAIDVLSTPQLDVRREAYLKFGIQSLVTVPLQIRGRPSGTITYYFRSSHQPSEVEMRIAQAVGQLAAAAISSAELYAEQHHLRAVAVRAAERSAFLADASARLASLDYEKNLEAIAHLIVPRFADWCVVDLLEAGELRRLAVAHSDPNKVEFARDVHRRYPPRRDVPGGLWHVVNTGEPMLVPEIDDQMLAAGSRDPEELALLRAVGVRSAMMVPLKRSSEVFGVVTFVLAESNHRYNEDDLEFAQELARRASYAIENARLYRQAQDASRAKDEFLAALSHELRTPLNAILGWASILRARPDGEIERGLDVIYRNAKVQTQLVEDLLDASRIVSGRMSIDLKDVPLLPIVESAVETIVPQAAEKDINVTTELPNPQLLVRGDAARLQQVFWNILNNAVKFTPRGGRIKVSTSASPSEIAVHITDTGAGIRGEALPYIFDRFRQADASSTRRYRGLGLGLTLSRQLTEMHGGRISASSLGAGRGATFSVALPIVERTSPRPSGFRIRPATDALAGVRILAVDDDPDSLEVLTSILRLHQANVIGATSATEALDLSQRERPDVIVSDIAMPEHDGYWLMQQLQRIAAEGGRSIPCIALTAFANEAARQRALSSGFKAHLSKPLNPEDLVSVIRPLIH